jgi:IclR family transcriptional regulator, KDG regulon repressor
MDGIQSLARGLQIVEMAVNLGRGLSITEIAAELSIDKSSASRLVKTLVSYGYLQPEPGTRRYVTGRRLVQIGWQMMSMMPIRQKARPLLQWLVNATGECSHTAVYAEGKALVIDDVETETTLRVAGRTGRMIPLHCTAVGKGLLAFGEVPMPDTLPPSTARTITEPELLQAHLDHIRQQGYALDDEEHESGIRCIAAPVYNYMGLAIATIGISGPTVRMTDACLVEFANYVKQAAGELSTALGYTGQRV